MIQASFIGQLQQVQLVDVAKSAALTYVLGRKVLIPVLKFIGGFNDARYGDSTCFQRQALHVLQFQFQFQIHARRSTTRQAAAVARPLCRQVPNGSGCRSPEEMTQRPTNNCIRLVISPNAPCPAPPRWLQCCPWSMCMYRRSFETAQQWTLPVLSNAASVAHSADAGQD